MIKTCGWYEAPPHESVKLPQKCSLFPLWIVFGLG